MIERQHGQLIYECDGCEETLETGEEDWGPAKAHFDRDGWKAEKVGNEWTHLCSKCRGRR